MADNLSFGSELKVGNKNKLKANQNHKIQKSLIHHFEKSQEGLFAQTEIETL
ncbi:hypothetical protein HXK64_00510 [Candidatus Gracilibacteria bacterium]|nr:hypothetical protein [Candidatus Gracilibacteria bacterium]